MIRFLFHFFISFFLIPLFLTEEIKQFFSILIQTHSIRELMTQRHNNRNGKKYAQLCFFLSFFLFHRFILFFFLLSLRDASFLVAFIFSVFISICLLSTTQTRNASFSDQKCNRMMQSLIFMLKRTSS